MARRANYLGSLKPIAAGAVQTITFTSSEIDSAGVVEFLLTLQGNAAAQPISGIDRIRLRAQGQTLYDCKLNQLLSMQARWNKANFFDAVTSQLLHIPLNLMDGPTIEARDQCQFPPGAEVQLEILTLGTVVVGSMGCGWVMTDQEPKYYPKFLSLTSNVPASTRNGKMLFSDTGIVRSLTFPGAGIDRAEVIVSNQRALHLAGDQFAGHGAGADTIGSLLFEKDAWESGSQSTIPSTGATSFTTVSTDLNLPGANGSTMVILDTGAAWPGAAGEIAIYSIVPLRRAA